MSSTLLDALARGILNSAERDQAEAHLLSCADCRRRYALIQSDSTTAPGVDQEATTIDMVAATDARPPARDSHPPAPNIPGYAELEIIARGGQGDVYSALQLSTHRRVALKVLLGAKPTPAQQIRFQREIEALASIPHPAIVTIYESGVADGVHYYSMAFIEGEPVSAYVRKHRLPARQILSLFAEIAEALGAAHQRRIVHRDIKPSNILVDHAGRPHVLDFGLARPAPTDAVAQQVTTSGEFIGTLAYAAPEQRRTSHLEASADVYSLGVVLFQALTQRMPYDLSTDFPKAVQNIFDSDAPAPSRVGADVDRDVDTIVRRALAQEPNRRYATCNELAEDLRRYLSGNAIEARRDNLTYVLRKNTLRQLTRHSAFAIAVGWLLSIVVGQILVGTGCLIRPLDRWFETRATVWNDTANASGWRDALSFIGLDDATYEALPELASSLGLPGIDPENVQSWRLLHGRLMTQLARAAPRMVVWDISFGAICPDFDPPLVEGIRQLRAGGAQVILGVKTFTPSGDPNLSPAVLASADGWGFFSLGITNEVVHSAALTVDAPPNALPLALALRAYAAFVEPGSEPAIVWHRDHDWLELRYRRRSPSGGSSSWCPRVDRIPISHRDDHPDVAHLGLSAGDQGARMAYLWVTLPERAVLEPHTHVYREILNLEEDALRAKFHGRIVFVSDNRVRYTDKPDRQTFNSGSGVRKEFAVYAHAAALNSLMHHMELSRPDLGLESLLYVSAATLGVATVLFARRWLRYGFLYVALAAMIAVLAVLMVGWTRQIISVASLVLVTWVAAAWTQQVLRAKHPYG